jgi:hypothetical protein
MTGLAGAALVEQLLAESWTEWDGNDPPEAFTNARFAVVVERDSDQWVRAAADWQAVVEIEDGCLAVEHDVEWVKGVWDIATGEAVTYGVHRATTLITPDGGVFVTRTQMTSIPDENRGAP